MKKFVFAGLICLFVFNRSEAQVAEDKIEYNKEKQPCLAIGYDYPPQAVENAFLGRMDKLGYKGKEEKGLFNKDKGFRVYRSALIPDINASPFDYVVEIEKKNKREDDKSVLYLIIMKDGRNALPGLKPAEKDKAGKFLEGLLPDIEAASLELQISAQEEVITLAEKKLKSLQDEKEDMEKKIRKLEDDLKENEKDQDKQKSEIDNQIKRLEELKGKRKSGN